ncbi:hypothetical protein [Pseudomonas atacamensis]|uniref:hypothetical protein n=1 Tax=Pseudomonas atacamensis TaxID=2565368 RepID=UPI00380173B3
MKYVQFSDASEGVVVSEFSCEQDSSVYQFLGKVDEQDPRYVQFVAPQDPQPLENPIDRLKEFLVLNPDVTSALASAG